MMNFMDRSIQIKAMASAPRIKVLKLLLDPEKHFGHQWSADAKEFGVCMTLIAEALKIAQPTASRHIDILKQADFITTKRHMKWSYCQRNEQAIDDYFQWFKSEVNGPD